jgi:hypothetical protein
MKKMEGKNKRQSEIKKKKWGMKLIFFLLL